jgi:hypothetical protein
MIGPFEGDTACRPCQVLGMSGLLGGWATGRAGMRAAAGTVPCGVSLGITYGRWFSGKTCVCSSSIYLS